MHHLEATMAEQAATQAPSSDFSISRATIEDLPKIVRLPTSISVSSLTNPQVDNLYTCFSQDFWDRKEPPALRKPHVTDAVRRERMIARVWPTFFHPHMRWMIARHVPTHEIIGVAAWVAPGCPVRDLMRRDSVEFYGWRSFFGTDAELDELWSHVDDKAWSGHYIETDALRQEVLGDEPHWYLASLMTLPAWQGRGVGRMLLDWAIEQADATVPVTPMYLETSVVGRKVYLKNGFVPQGGEGNMLRRGPAVVKEGEDGKIVVERA